MERGKGGGELVQGVLRVVQQYRELSPRVMMAHCPREHRQHILRVLYPTNRCFRVRHSTVLFCFLLAPSVAGVTTAVVVQLARAT